MRRLFCSPIQGKQIKSGLFFLVFACLAIASIPGLALNEADSESDPVKLLITEVSTVGTGQEFVEIFNPNAVNVDLSNYYLTDAIYNPGAQYYFRIGEGNPSQATVGGGAFSDFHARFPDGFTIAAGDTIVITIPGSTQFFENFGFNPDLELFEDDEASDAVPDMRWIFGTTGENSIISSQSTPTLTNAAETVVLYHYLTGEDKVVDIDVFAWKDPSSATTSFFFNKTGVIIGSHFYLPEIGTNSSYAFTAANQFGNSYHRTDVTEGDQTPTGSNGVDGRDETSENFNTTFASMPYDPAAPGDVSRVVYDDPPKHAALLGNTPNPFNPLTIISFDLPKQMAVRLMVYDVSGRLTDVLIDNQVSAQGRNEIVWRGRDMAGRAVSAGVYFYRLEAGNFSETKRMVLVK